MGKATRWIRGLFGMKKGKENVDNNNSNCGEKNEKKRRSFAVKSGKDLSRIPMRSSVADSAEMEQNKHAIAVAAATAAAADAAVAAAQAAAAVVRLTSQGRGAGGRERWAAIKIQSVFRGYLARKALRALKGLVKLQALIRGYLVRKRAASTLYSMQALMRAQSAIRCERARINMNHRTRLQPETRSRKSIEKFERSEFHSRRHSSCYEAFNESPKIVEIDTCGPRSRSRRMSITSDYNYDQYHQTIEEFDWGFVKEDYKFATAQNTPRLGCSGGRGNAPPVTPPKSVCGDGRYANGPSYMANTQSSQAKLRSLSAPMQRPEPGPMKRLSLSEIVAARSSFSGGRMQRACPQVHEDFEF